MLRKYSCSDGDPSRAGRRLDPPRRRSARPPDRTLHNSRQTPVGSPTPRTRPYRAVRRCTRSGRRRVTQIDSHCLHIRHTRRARTRLSLGRANKMGHMRRTCPNRWEACRCRGGRPLSRLDRRPRCRRRRLFRVPSRQFPSLRQSPRPMESWQRLRTQASK
jgi:hypothetical protein